MQSARGIQLVNLCCTVRHQAEENAQPVATVFLPNSSTEPHTLETVKICLPLP